VTPRDQWVALPEVALELLCFFAVLQSTQAAPRHHVIALFFVLSACEYRHPLRTICSETTVARDHRTVNSFELVVVPPPFVMVIGPVVAVAGTVTVMTPEPPTVKAAEVEASANLTAVVPTKLPPSMVILAPGFALAGEKMTISGAGEASPAFNTDIAP